MSQENVELVYRAVEAFNRRDFPALAEFIHDEFEFVSLLTAVDGEAATYRGQAAWETYASVMDDLWEGWRVEQLRVFDGSSDRVSGIFRLVGKGRHSRVPVERETGIVYEIREGRMWRARSYGDPVEALEVAGVAGIDRGELRRGIDDQPS